MTHLFCIITCVWIAMTVTQDYVEHKFEEFNVLIFDGKLKPLPVRLSSARTFLGQLRYRRVRSLIGGCKFTDFQLVISRKLDMDERLLEDTVIHEMIHYYILSHQMRDTSAHGTIFRRMMTDINERFGRNISIRHRITDEESEKDTEVRRHLICVSRFADGSLGITISARTSIFCLWRELPCLPNVVECSWYMSLNPYFNRFRRSRTPKIYRIDKDELEQHLVSAVRLIKEGKVIRSL